MLTLIGCVSWLNSHKSYVSLIVTQSLLYDSKCVDNTFAHLKMLIYPTHSDYYSLAIKLHILSLSNFYLFSFSFVCRGKDHLQMTDSDKITPCIAIFLQCASDVKVSLEDVLNHVTKYFLTCIDS